MSFITDGQLDPPDTYEPDEHESYEPGWTEADYLADAADRWNDEHARET